MSMEAVFSAVGGVIILHETLSVREWVGCGIMLLTIFYSNSPIGSLSSGSLSGRRNRYPGRRRCPGAFFREGRFFPISSQAI